MNDRFKFRAFDTFAEKMIQNHISICEGELYEWCPDGLHIKHDIGDSAIVMQSTGLKDKNGKLIYEKDYVRYANNKYEVEIDKFLGISLTNILNGDTIVMDDIVLFNCEVIGNEFESNTKI